MAYTAYDVSKPTTAQTRQAAIDAIRTNLAALRDMVAAGTLLGWGATVSGGTADQPTQVLHSRGTSEYIKETIVWGGAGGALGNPSTITYAYSTVAGGAGAYDTIGTITFTYDGNGNVVSWAWS